MPEQGPNAVSKMLLEIREQPAVLERSLAESISPAEQLRRCLEKQRPRLIVIAARGTSDAAALFGKYLLEITTGIPVALAAPSISTLYQADLDVAGALVVAISQSGESPDVNSFLERARGKGALTLGITNQENSALASLAEYVLLVHAGEEQSVAATKTYTAELLALYLLARCLGAPIELDHLRELPAWVNSALTLESQIRDYVASYRKMSKTVVVGRGLNYSSAFEFALKLMETCYVVAERFSSADFLHGPIAVVDESFPVFLFAPAGPTWPSIRMTLERLRTLKAETLVITDQANKGIVGAGTRLISIPANLERGIVMPDELYTPIPYIVPAQIFAALLSEEKHLNPDHPRGLAKVTRTL